MDITQTTAAKSDQQNFDDYMTGITRTVTITEVKGGSSEQPVEIHIAEYPGRPYKPSKSMRRVLVASWGAETSAYIGRKMILFGDPNVKFGGQTVGGIKISHLSHIDKPIKIALTITRGKREPFVVQPLRESQVSSTPNPLADKAQVDRIFALLSQLEITVRDEMLAKINSIIEPHIITSSAELTAEEATIVINVLSAEVESRN
jgi:hypothetical protein